MKVLTKKKESKKKEVDEDIFSKKLEAISMPKVIEIHQIGSITCPPCNVCRLGFSQLELQHKGKFKFKYFDNTEVKRNPELAMYVNSYPYIPKLFVIIDDKPIFMDTGILPSPVNFINTVYLYLEELEPSQLKVTYAYIMDQLEKVKID
jgi:hypothetical protein